MIRLKNNFDGKAKENTVGAGRSYGAGGVSQDSWNIYLNLDIYCV